MVKRLKEILMWAGKVDSIDFVVIHNDAGGSSWTGQAYIDWLRDRNKALGIAHFYITKDDIAQVLEIGDIGYHTGEWWSNTHSIGYEICNSHDQYGVDNDTFKLNEEMCLRKVAEDMKALGLPVNRNTVRLHREFVPTSCPNRSWALHGQDVNAVKDYFISRIKYYMSIGDTVEEMLQTETEEKKEKENEVTDMITISAPGRGIALMMGGKFLPILDSKTPTVFWAQGVKHYQLDTKTFDAWQGKAEKSTLDDTTVKKLINGLKK